MSEGVEARSAAGERVAASYIDPFGRLSRDREHYVREVGPEAATWLRPLHDRGRLAELARSAHLVPCEAEPGLAPDEPRAWIVRHPAVEPLTLPAEWCGSMLLDAALATLDLLIAVGEDGLTLQDAHPQNVVFDGARPIFVDLTSLVPQQPDRLWTAYGQFVDAFWHPLLLHADRKGDWARRALLDPLHGIPVSSLCPLLSTRARARRPGLMAAAWFDRVLQRRERLRRSLRARAMAPGRDVPPEVRRRFVTRLRARTAGLRIATARADRWSEYYEGIDAGPGSERKLAVVEAVLGEIRPRSVLDIGCNTGRYSRLAAASGARVLAIDQSEDCVEMLYDAARREDLPITPIVADVLAPTPAHGFLAREYAPLPERARCDAVLCLGLVHHLMVNGRQSPDRVAELIDALAARAAVVELVDPDDDNIALLDSARAIDYARDDLARALERRFARIEISPSDRETRRLAVCRR